MKFDLLGKTEQIRRKVKAILFDRKNRKLSDKMYDKLGEFMEKLNEEGACVPEEYIEKVNSGLSELARLNNTRVEEVRADMTRDMEKINDTMERANETLGINPESDFASRVNDITK